MISVVKTESRRLSRSANSPLALIDRYGLLALIFSSAALYFWNLPINGWGNPYYAAAAQAGEASSQGLVFGSLDLANALSVDKPPLHTALLSMGVRLFGLSSWAVLAPNALLGVACVWLTYLTVRRVSNPRLALLSGALFLLTPVALLMFRFNNPDTTMLFLWCLAAFLAARMAQTPTYAKYSIVGLVIALAFLTKQFQSLIIVPALLAAVTSRQNVKTLLHWLHAGTTAMVAMAIVGAWFLAVELTPPSQRPWIGGSITNSATELTFGYNGLGRLTGLTSLGAINPRGYDGVVGVDAGLLRLFSPNFAGELSWFFLPAILGLGLSLHRLLSANIDRREKPLAKLMVVWFASAFLVVSFMTGNVHPYYTLMIAPPMCYLSSVAVQYLAIQISNRSGRRLAALTILASAFMSLIFLSRYRDLGAVPFLILAFSAVLAAGILIFGPRISGFKVYVGLFSIIVLLLAPVLFNYVTIATPQQGSFPQAGPVPTIDTWHRRNAEQLQLNQQESYALSRGEPVVASVAEMVADIPQSIPWPAMTVGGENAALYQLHTGRPVVAIGGFSGSDQFPQEDFFRKVISKGEAGYYIHQPGILKWGPSSDNTNKIVHWIVDHCQRTRVEHLDLYDLRLCKL